MGKDFVLIFVLSFIRRFLTSMIFDLPLFSRRTRFANGQDPWQLEQVRDPSECLRHVPEVSTVFVLFETRSRRNYQKYILEVV